MAKILVVEDDQPYALSLKDWLSNELHIVDIVHDGASAQELVALYHYDLVILDWQLPVKDGLSVCAELRRSGFTVPVLMLTGKDKLAEVESGLDTGADDYLIKPVQLREISARVRALLRRSGQAVSKRTLRVRDIELDTKSHTVTKNSSTVELFPREFALLEFFMRNPHQIYSAEQLLDRVWSSSTEASSNTVRSCVNRIRTKLDNPGEPSVIKTVYSVGYILDEDVS